MAADFYTATHTFRRMEFSEIKQLEPGDEVAVCVYMEFPHTARFIRSTVVTPLFWNSDADTPNWEIETTSCFADIYSIYDVKEV